MPIHLDLRSAQTGRVPICDLHDRHERSGTMRAEFFAVAVSFVAFGCSYGAGVDLFDGAAVKEGIDARRDSKYNACVLL